MDIDRYRRMVGLIIMNGRDINREMIRGGWAWSYRQYLKAPYTSEYIRVAAGVAGKTPHCARHSTGIHLMKKFGNIAAVQRQLGHKNAAYGMQYARVTARICTMP